MQQLFRVGQQQQIGFFNNSGNAHSAMNCADEVCPNVKQVVVQDAETGTGLWDAVSGREIRRFPLKKPTGWNSAISHDGALVAIPDAEDESVVIRVFDTKSGKHLQSLRASADRPATRLSWSPDGQFLARSDADQIGRNTIQLWDLRTAASASARWTRIAARSLISPSRRTARGWHVPPVTA